jgi:hypothetical protein
MAMLPNEEEMISTAMVGGSQRGWYRVGGEALSEVFGQDYPRFAALLAAMSPRISVQKDLQFAMEMWERWIASGRTTDADRIADMIPAGPPYTAVHNNIQTVLKADMDRLMDPDILREGGLLSGMKVDPFYGNLMGQSQRLTFDTWMTTLGVTEPRAQTLSRNLGETVAYRSSAERMSERVGAPVSVAEMQEMQWGVLKRGREMAGDKPGSFEEMLFPGTKPRAQGELPMGEESFVSPVEELEFGIERGTPNFANLMMQPEYAARLERMGLKPPARLIEPEGLPAGAIERAELPQDLLDTYLRRMAQRSDEFLAVRARQAEAGRKLGVEPGGWWYALGGPLAGGAARGLLQREEPQQQQPPGLLGVPFRGQF